MTREKLDRDLVVRAGVHFGCILVCSLLTVLMLFVLEVGFTTGFAIWLMSLVQASWTWKVLQQAEKAR